MSEATEREVASARAQSTLFRTPRALILTGDRETDRLTSLKTLNIFPTFPLVRVGSEKKSITSGGGDELFLRRDKIEN